MIKDGINMQDENIIFLKQLKKKLIKKAANYICPKEIEMINNINFYDIHKRFPINQLLEHSKTYIIFYFTIDFLLILAEYKPEHNSEEDLLKSGNCKSFDFPNADKELEKAKKDYINNIKINLEGFKLAQKTYENLINSFSIFTIYRVLELEDMNPFTTHNSKIETILKFSLDNLIALANRTKKYDHLSNVSLIHLELV
jgi:hypothetical protein